MRRTKRTLVSTCWKPPLNIATTASTLCRLDRDYGAPGSYSTSMAGGHRLGGSFRQVEPSRPPCMRKISTTPHEHCSENGMDRPAEHVSSASEIGRIGAAEDLRP